MSGSLSFLSYLRTGSGGAITTPASDGHASLTVQSTLSVNGADRDPVSVSLPLAGPGEVVGLAAGAIRRRWPRPGADDAEPNLLAQLELVEPDLPWRYSPEAHEDERLRPWLTLIALRVSSLDNPNAPSEIASQTSPGRGGGLPTITLRAETPLPDLSLAWAWAHVQWSQGSAGLKDDLLNRPRALCSRILCPRQLEPRCTWLAALVPTYQRGVLRGLGDRSLLDQLAKTKATALAWEGTESAGTLRLPVYASWTFSTAEAEDFESLVNALVPRRAADLSGLGSFEVRLDYPTRTGGLAQRVAMPGALQVPGQALPRRVAGRGELLDAIGAEVLPSSGPADPVVKPPLYGARHILADRLGADGEPRWFRELNGDPRWRAAAGLGAEIVRRDQRELLDEAWDQYEKDLKEENARRARARFGATLRQRALDRVLPEQASSLDDPRARAQRDRADALLGHAMLPGTPSGVEPQLRRVLRGSGRLARRAGLGSVAETRCTVTARVGQPGGIGLPAHTLELGLSGPSPAELGATNLPLSFSSPELGGAALPDLGAVVGATGLIDAEALRAEVEARVRAVIDAANLQHRDRLYRLRQALAVKPAPPPLVAEPEFVDPPLSERLERLSKNWILPGLDGVPLDSVLLLEENRPFIEAIALGATVEMSRELLYHEFPTDERGSLFRRFWRGVDRDARDMMRHHEWAKSLGGHRTGGAGPRLVLLIRGRLLLRYPSPMVSLIKAGAWSEELGRHTVLHASHEPVLGDFIEPDIGYYGFELTERELREGDGWFLCIQEQPTAPRFGTDAKDRSEIVWTTWKHAAQAASALWQPTARVLIHSDLLLPPPPEND